MPLVPGLRLGQSSCRVFAASDWVHWASSILRFLASAWVSQAALPSPPPLGCVKLCRILLPPFAWLTRSLSIYLPGYRDRQIGRMDNFHRPSAGQFRSWPRDCSLKADFGPYGLLLSTFDFESGGTESHARLTPAWYQLAKAIFQVGEVSSSRGQAEANLVACMWGLASNCHSMGPCIMIQIPTRIQP